MGHMDHAWIVPRTRVKFGERAFFVAAAPLPKHGTGCQQRTQVDAFHASLQAFLENVLVPDFRTL